MQVRKRLFSIRNRTLSGTTPAQSICILLRNVISIPTELEVISKFSPANDGRKVRLDWSCDERRSIIIHGENAHSRFAFGTDDSFTGKFAITAEANVKAFGD